MIFDAHAHYDDSAFDEDRDTVIEEMKQNGVIGVLNCGTSLKGSRDSVNLAVKYDYFYAAVGIHPEYALELNDEVLAEFRECSKNTKVRAIGEIGLDYFYDENPDREIQKSVFRKQMKLAEELKLPVIIHDRDAHEDTLKIMKEFPNVIGEVHCFSGSVEFARECIKLGYYLGFTGVVTFKNARKSIEVIKDLPIYKILVETDCPYMAPVPNRGKRNRSEYISFIYEKIAEIKQISRSEVVKNINNNIRHLLNIRN